MDAKIFYRDIAEADHTRVNHNVIAEISRIDYASTTSSRWFIRKMGVIANAFFLDDFEQYIILFFSTLVFVHYLFTQVLTHEMC